MEFRCFHGPDLRTAKVLQERTLYLSICGRVQGVGFRDAMSREAERLGITGWVRNRADGKVEAVVQGSAAAVQALLAWSRLGPPAARVERVDCGPPGPEHARSYARFERWPSA
ncbi:MAG: acylphosphatase [Betaproteobacteria bacterium]|nr:acylphosphatase [Betaproteobacteria bacterium]